MHNIRAGRSAPVSLTRVLVGGTIQVFTSKGAKRMTAAVLDTPLDLFALRRQRTADRATPFLEPDAFEGPPSDPLYLHKYMYANGNPVANTDPSGMFVPLLLGAVAVSFLLSIAGCAGYTLGADERIVRTAIADASDLVANSLRRLSRWNPDDRAHFRTWFGTPSWQSRLAVTNVLALTAEVLAQPITWHRLAPNDRDYKSSLFAFVYPYDGKFEVWLGPQFWDAPDKGTDSKAGTMIHEMTHESGSTLDHQYGVPNTKSLAKLYPDDAIRNADNYQYFCEEVP